MRGLVLFITIIVGGSLILGLSPIFTKRLNSKMKSGEYRILTVQEEKKRESDPLTLQVLREFQKKLDEWLTSINERIENEDITRFEVRFLEILRNILEWIKEKVDAKIESYESDWPKEKGKRVRFQEVHLRGNFLI